MKRVITRGIIGLSGIVLAGCNWFGGDTNGEDEIVVVEMQSSNPDEAKQECLSQPNYQWNDSEVRCEKPTEKTVCLYAGNQWNEKDELCEFSKATCIAEDYQWNEQTSSCEFTKEQCLAMEAQWDEQENSCERQPQTSEQKLADCVEEGGQWDYAAGSCQMMQDSDSKDQMSAENSASSYAMSEVAAHASADDCWATINGKVYNLTSWVSQHPGGSDKIIAICGTDATETFSAQHGGKEKPENQLMTFEIGVLAQ